MIDHDREEEQRLIGAAQRDPQAFGPLYERYHRTIFLFVHRRVGARELAADLTQQTFLKALLALPKYTHQGMPFRAWLYRIALNELRMHWRKRKEVVMELSVAEVRSLARDMGPQVLRDLESADEQRLLAQGLGRLKEEQARLIELRYFDGLSFAELGEVLGIAEAAAKMRTHRVLAELRTYLEHTR